jgi:hypothetical protein
MVATNTNPPSPTPISYDPFSYPHLYPSGWNLDDAGKDPRMAENQDLEPELVPEKSSLPAWYEPFHDLRTFPSGWDLP